jgi:hypothetical protein
MTDPEGEDLESAGPRWKGGIELSSSPDGPLRHWWRFDPREPGLVHRASGERLVYVGGLRDPGCHQFDYRHEDIAYSLAVKLKRVWWPNPVANRRLPPRYDELAPAELQLHVWQVDHVRSAELWRDWGAPKFDVNHSPPFWLWSRVDRAIIDAALLWPKGVVPGIAPATEVAINGGWLNGLWREGLFRRLRHYDDYGQGDHGRDVDLQPARSIRQLGLPLSDYHVEDMGTTPSSWSCVVESAVDLYGQRTYPQAAMRDSLTGTSITVSNGSIRQMEPLPHPAFVVLRDRIAWAAEGQAHGVLRDNRPPGHPIPIRLATSWDVRMDGHCSTTPVGGHEDGAATSWLGKTVRAFDGIARRELPPYDPTIVNHPLSSYRSWRFLYDCLLNALPFSPGFEEEDLGAGMVQGDYGQIKIVGGFVGGIQRLTTELRLKLELPSDEENTRWTKFFS